MSTKKCCSPFVNNSKVDRFDILLNNRASLHHILQYEVDVFEWAKDIKSDGPNVSFFKYKYFLSWTNNLLHHYGQYIFKQSTPIANDSRIERMLILVLTCLNSPKTSTQLINEYYSSDSLIVEKMRSVSFSKMQEDLFYHVSCGNKYVLNDEMNTEHFNISSSTRKRYKLISKSKHLQTILSDMIHALWYTGNVNCYKGIELILNHHTELQKLSNFQNFIFYLMGDILMYQTGWTKNNFEDNYFIRFGWNKLFINMYNPLENKLLSVKFVTFLMINNQMKHYTIDLDFFEQVRTIESEKRLFEIQINSFVQRYQLNIKNAVFELWFNKTNTQSNNSYTNWANKNLLSINCNVCLNVFPKLKLTFHILNSLESYTFLHFYLIEERTQAFCVDFVETLNLNKTFTSQLDPMHLHIFALNDTENYDIFSEWQQITGVDGWRGIFYESFGFLPNSTLVIRVSRIYDGNFEHEMTHAFSYHIRKIKQNKTPSWITEGIAMFFQCKPRFDQTNSFHTCYNNSKLVHIIQNHQNITCQWFKKAENGDNHYRFYGTFYYFLFSTKYQSLFLPLIKNVLIETNFDFVTCDLFSELLTDFKLYLFSNYLNNL